MEDTLRVRVEDPKNLIRCLNPCFNGRYSQSFSKFNLRKFRQVLILVLMEDTLRERLNITIEFFSCVLILVLMEDTLRVFITLLKQ